MHKTYRINRGSLKKEMWVIEYFVRLQIPPSSVNIVSMSKPRTLEWGEHVAWVERGERGRKFCFNTCRNDTSWEIMLQWILKIACSSRIIIIIIIIIPSIGGGGGGGGSSSSSSSTSSSGGGGSSSSIGWFRGASAWTAICAYRQSLKGPKASYVC